MLKVKHQRTADCVVAGFRTHKDGAGVGSLLLGLYDDEGTLHHVGVASGFSVARRRELVDEVKPYRSQGAGRAPMGGLGRGPGLGTRARRHEPLERRQGHDLGTVAARGRLEVSYDHLQHDRFRHATSLVRWRPDREPSSCTYEQLDTPVPMELADVFGTPAT